MGPDRVASFGDDSSDSSSDESESESFTSSLDDVFANNISPEIDQASHRFPSSCLKIVANLPGNNRCIDCGGANPGWASVSYGILLCLSCSGKHRSFGVSVSRV